MPKESITFDPSLGYKLLYCILRASTSTAAESACRITHVSHDMQYFLLCYGNTNTTIDHLSEKLATNEYFVYLAIERKDYSNAMLTSDFYTEKTKPLSILFLDCGFEIVTANTFQPAVFEEMRHLGFGRIKIIDFQLGAFNGLSKLTDFWIHTVAIKNLHYNTLKPLASTLKRVRLIKIELENMYNLIGVLTFYKLEKFHFTFTKLCTIFTSNCLAQLPNIWHISFGGCDIEAIELGAFDRYAKTIEVIQIYRNRLKTLPAKLFDNLVHLKVDKLLIIDNPWECDCDVLALTRKFSGQQMFSIECTDERLVGNQTDCAAVTPNIDRSPMEMRRCCHHYGTNGLRVSFHTTYRIRLADGGTKLRLKKSKRTCFYVLIYSTDEARMQCVRLTTRYDYLLLDRFKLAPGVQFVVAADPLDLGTASPMHMISFYMAGNHLWLHQDDKLFVLAASAGIYIVAFIFTFLVGIFGDRSKIIALGNGGRGSTATMLESRMNSTRATTPMNEYMSSNFSFSIKTREFETCRNETEHNYEYISHAAANRWCKEQD